MSESLNREIKFRDKVQHFAILTTLYEVQLNKKLSKSAVTVFSSLFLFKPYIHLLPWKINNTQKIFHYTEKMRRLFHSDQYFYLLEHLCNPILYRRTFYFVQSERFLPHDAVTMATVYAPISFPPAPVLVFTDNCELLATGTVAGSDPNRVVVKKIVLSGHPFKINKKSSVVRYMFFNRGKATKKEYRIC